MGYEFEDVSFEVIIEKEDFPKLIRELENTKGTSWMPEELYIKKEGYADIVWEDDFNKEDYKDMHYLNIKHRGCFKWSNIKEWLYVFNKYCLGDMYFTGDYGESVVVEFKGEEEYVLSVQEYRVIPEEEWNEGFKNHFYP